MAKKTLEDVLAEPITDEQRVMDWRLRWLLEGGYSRKNAEKLAKDKDIDFRYAIQVLHNAKTKGYDEKFVVDLLT